MSSHLSQIQNWPELAKQAKWKASSLAKQCGVSLRTLERHFKFHEGKKPKAWIFEQRQRAAQKLLSDGRTVKETAQLLFYTHPSHLSNDYKKHYGKCAAIAKINTVKCIK